MPELLAEVDSIRVSDTIHTRSENLKGCCKRLRIALVVHDCAREFGHGRYVMELATRFRCEHDVHIFANTFEEPRLAGVSYHWVPALRANALTTIVSFIFPATLMLGRGFDIVHAQGLCGVRQDVMTAHVCQAGWNGAIACHLGRQGWRKRVFRCVVGRLEKWAFRPNGTSWFIAVSQRVQNDLKRHYRLSEHVSVIHHGTDTKTFHPRNQEQWRTTVRMDLGLTSTDFVALYVGDLQKAGAPAIEAMARAPFAKLVIVSRSDVGPYARLAAQAGATNRIQFVPPTKSIERFYAAADLLLFPTCYDAFGLVVTEAMASGIPVITSRAAGAAELIEHGVNGWLTDDPWNVDQIVSGLRAFSDDPSMRKRLGREARARIEEQTWDRVAAETMQVYQEVVKARRSRSAPTG